MLDEVGEEPAAEVGWMHKSDSGIASARSASRIDHVPTLAVEVLQNRVYILGGESDVHKPRTAPFDEFGDGALVPFGVAFPFTQTVLRFHHRIEILHDLQVAIADGDKGTFEPAKDFRRPGVIYGAVFVGNKAFGHVANFHIHFRAFQGTAKRVDEDANVFLNVRAGYSYMVNPFYPAFLHRKVEPFDEAGSNSACFVRCYGDKAFVDRADTCLSNLKSVPFCCPGRINRAQRHVMDAGSARRVKIRIFRIEDTESGVANTKEGYRPALDCEIGPHQPKRATEETADCLGVAGDERQIVQRKTGQGLEFLPLHEMHQDATDHRRVHETYQGATRAGAADRVYRPMAGRLDLCQ